ncbi:MarR family transcriptional regulator [Streptomyces venezuelae ATCC 10712]|nr:MarR family transcriptional regulator [Streptomyces venezuelae ATCC 10712]
MFALGALNAALAQARVDFGGVSTGLCLCACTAGLFGEDLLQRDYRRDRAVLAYVARHPGVDVRQVARAIEDCERVAFRSLARLTKEGLLAWAVDRQTSGERVYRIAR